MDLACLHILGSSPSFIGVVQRESDSRIEMPSKKKKSETEIKRCNAKVVAETGGLIKGLNTGKFNFVLEQEITLRNENVLAF